MPDNAVTILTYNIYDQREGPFAFEKRINLLAETIAGVNPDVICLQEVPSDQFVRALTAFLHRQLGKSPRVAMTLVPRHDGREFRVALFHPGTRRTAKRIATPDGRHVAVEVLLGAMPLTVVSTHLESRSDEVRLAQCQAIVDATAGYGAVVVCGDLNAAPGSPELQLLGESFSSLAPAADVSHTHPTGLRPEHREKPKAVLDHILGRGVTVTASGVVGLEPNDEGLFPSDHAGVWATVTLG